MKFSNILKSRPLAPPKHEAPATSHDARRSPAAPFTRGNGERPAQATTNAFLNATRWRLTVGQPLGQRTPANLSRVTQEAVAAQQRRENSADPTVSKFLKVQHRRLAEGRPLSTPNADKVHQLAVHTVQVQGRKAHEERGITPDLNARILSAQRDADRMLDRMIQTPIIMEDPDD